MILCIIGTKIKQCLGFTLIEALVSISVLLIISGVAVSIFISVLSGQKNVLAGQEISGQLSYSLEYMSRALRMAGKDLTGNCLGQEGYNYILTRCSSSEGVCKGIKFINQSDDGICQEFFLDDVTDPTKTIIKEIKGSGMPVVFGSPVALTSDKIKINNFKFIINGDKTNLNFSNCAGQIPCSSENDSIQPRITISLSAVFLDSNRPATIIQTTVSQRNLNIK